MIMNEICKPDAALARLILPQKPHPGLFYIPSQFVLPLIHRGKHYAFHLLTKQLIEAELPLSAHAGEGFDPLIETMFLVPEGKDECAYYESVAKMMRLFGQKKGIPCYTILPTLGCNARCIYCYEEGRKQVTMTPEIVEQTIRYILETRAEGTVKLKWFGGEPLLCPGIIDRVSDALREAGVPFKSSVVSNGSLITPAIVEKMTTRWNVTNIQNSMDGAEPDYIVRKHYYADAGQYHFVMDALSRLSAAGIRVSLRCNVDDGNWDGIPEFMDDLKENVAHKDNIGVYFSPLMDVRTSDGELDFWEKVIAARPLIEAAGFRPRAYNEPSMRFKANRCMADGGSIVIEPDGSLYSCEHCPSNGRFGDVFHGVTDEATKTEFCRSDRTREKCRKCPFLPECTSFASCPWTDAHCREMREMLTLDFLKRLIDRKTNTEEPDGDDSVC